MTTPTYSFLPWVRHGAGNIITQADLDPSVLVRVSVPIELTLTGRLGAGAPESRPLPKVVPLFGPADIVGIDGRAVIRVEPPAGITNFEANLLPFIEFYDEDFPWRYTPAAPDTARQRLRPWIALVVLKETEFSEAKNVKNQPLPHFDLAEGVAAENVFPNPAELWAWAHVHVNRDVAPDTDGSPAHAKAGLEGTLDENPDLAHARLICPRRLEPNVGYHAFLIPVFEGGRLAGLGLEIPDSLVATASAWDAGQTAFPYYRRWYFKTATLGDFEYLVKLLKPAVIGAEVGRRPIDVLHPGADLPPIEEPADLDGVLRLGGLLKVPDEALSEEERADAARFEAWDDPYPHAFQTAMAERVNLGSDYQHGGVGPPPSPEDDHPDPIVVSPLYGRWHAMVDRLLTDADGAPVAEPRNWVHELNLDPRFRIGAALGARVVQKNQEEYMQAAWEQVGDVLAANRVLKRGQLARAASLRLYQRYLAPLEPERLLTLTAPVHKRVVSEGLTVHGHVLSSRVPKAVLSAPFRRLARPSATVVKRLSARAAPSVHRIVAGINAGTLLPAPPKVAPAGALLLSDAAAAVRPTDAAPAALETLERAPWLRFVPLLFGLVLLLLAFLLPVSGVVAAVFGALALATVFIFTYLARLVRGLKVAAMLNEENETPEAVDALPTVDNFVLSTPGDGFSPRPGATDSEVAVRFKLALKDAFTLTAAPARRAAPGAIALASLAGRTLSAIDPKTALVKRLLGTLRIPPRLKDAQTDTFVPVMAHPIIDTPMYKPLSELGTELFLPNIDKIPRDSLTLLEPNQRFIEAYMLGLNHEMARELLWRGYPTDQRGSVFRQCWDVSALLSPGLTRAERDLLYDIKPAHRWRLGDDLGENHPNPAVADARLVLVVRGELLKRYPGTVIYAQKADWHRGADGTADVDAERELVELTPAEQENPPRGKLRRPLFEAGVEPDIYFVGFDLDPSEARGGTSASEDAGWFFVFQERAGETRMGADEDLEETPPRLVNWNNLSWGHLGTAPGGCIALDRTLAFVAYQEPVDQENRPIAADAQAGYSPSTNSAELAYILYQVPVMVAVHASRMLLPEV
ncbi:MAG TPA: hypothetical protein VF989_18195 [Polyangiaceae bacterium]